MTDTWHVHLHNFKGPYQYHAITFHIKKYTNYFITNWINTFTFLLCQFSHRYFPKFIIKFKRWSILYIQVKIYIFKYLQVRYISSQISEFCTKWNQELFITNSLKLLPKIEIKKKAPMLLIYIYFHRSIQSIRCGNVITNGQYSTNVHIVKQHTNVQTQKNTKKPNKWRQIWLTTY
jgi:hypothetical protein